MSQPAYAFVPVAKDRVLLSVYDPNAPEHVFDLSFLQRVLTAIDVGFSYAHQVGIWPAPDTDDDVVKKLNTFIINLKRKEASAVPAMVEPLTAKNLKEVPHKEGFTEKDLSSSLENVGGSAASGGGAATAPHFTPALLRQQTLQKYIQDSKDRIESDLPAHLAHLVAKFGMLNTGGEDFEKMEYRVDERTMALNAVIEDRIDALTGKFNVVRIATAEEIVKYKKSDLPEMPYEIEL